MSRPIRADKFITTHLSSFTVRSLLAMSTRNELLPSIIDNEQITGNSATDISINETEPIAPNTSKNNLFKNILLSPIVLRKSKFETVFDSPTHIRVEFHNPEEIDNISDNTNELNLEHN